MDKGSNAFLPLALLVMIAACNQPAKTVQTKEPFILTGNFDSSVKPGDNFYLFVNGKWIRNAVFPPTDVSLGAGKEIYDRTKEHIRSILDSVSHANNSPGTEAQKVGDFYASGMDSATIEKLGYEPVKPYLQSIDSIKDSKGVMEFVAGQQLENNSLLFQPFVGADEKNSTKNIAIFYQGGLGLPDRDYYFRTDPATLAIQNAYKTYIRKVFMLTGSDSTTASSASATIYNIEKQIAGAHRTNVELRDPQLNYNKMAVSALNKRMPAFGWPSLLQKMEIKSDSVNVSQPGFYEKLNELLKTVPLNSWKLYLKFHVIDNAAPAISSNFVNARFEYAGRALSGQQQIKPRWERIYRSTNDNLGMALGKLYVEKYFTEASKKRMLELINNLQKAFETRIDKLDWMSDSTKAKAKAKLFSIIKKIGYPDKWRDYGKVTIQKGKYFENLVACSRDEFQYQINKVGKPVDRAEWGITPPTVDAYYNPTFNEIVFPAGILQAPIFNEDADDAMNYGGIGIVIGHEMTHGFDDQGAQYDKDGNLRNWWGKEDSDRFVAKSKAVVDQYNQFVVLDSLHINGALTTGENIADMGGVAIAYDAFKLTSEGRDSTKIDGFTGDQRFFISVAQIWRSKRKDEVLRQGINTDPHSPPMYRVMGPLMNFTPFYTAFSLKEGDKMWKPEQDRIRIW